MDNKVRIYAHRGASKLAPENTMAAFRKAVELGSHGIECDVQMSSDGQLIICHDENLERTTNGKGYLKDYTMEQLRALDAGSWFGPEYKGEKLPTLDEVLELIKETGLLINIEIKDGSALYPGIEEKVVDAVKKHGLKEKTIVSSFNHYSVKLVKKLCSSLKTGTLYTEGLYKPWEYMEIVGCDCAHPNYITLNPQIVKGLRQRGFLVNTYTVDDPNFAKRLIDMGVNGIISNCPDKILQIL